MTKPFFTAEFAENAERKEKERERERDKKTLRSRRTLRLNLESFVIKNLLSEHSRGAISHEQIRLSPV